MTDNYRNKIKQSSWTWREQKVDNVGRTRNKDRVSDRDAKRGAKAKDLRMLNEERASCV